jgi:hypothetical protein
MKRFALVRCRGIRRAVGVLLMCGRRLFGGIARCSWKNFHPRSEEPLVLVAPEAALSPHTKKEAAVAGGFDRAIRKLVVI